MFEAIGLSAVFILGGWLWIHQVSYSFGGLVFDRFGYFFSLIIVATAWFAIFKTREKRAFILLSALGAIIMVHAEELASLYIGVELMTVPLILWTAFERGLRGQEANLKYYLTAGCASVFLLYGTALLYGATGTTVIAEMRPVIVNLEGIRVTLFIGGAVMTLAALAFKLSWVPFHFTVPDIYQGAPTAATSFISITTKVAGMAVLLRLFNGWVHAPSIFWQGIFVTGAVISLLIGNLQALPQTNFKRLLAYGSIGHAGFMLVGLAAAATAANFEQALESLLFYLIAYALMMIGCFAVILAVEKGEGGDEISDYAGLARRHPWLAALLSLFLLSAVGIPGTIGFTAKFSVVTAALEAELFGLVAFAIIAALIGAYAYCEVILTLYAKDSKGEGLPPLSYSLLTVLVLALLGTLYWGLFPSNLLLVVGESVQELVF